MSRISEIRVVNPAQFDAEFPRLCAFVVLLLGVVDY